MLLNSILFYFFAALAVGSAILMVTRRNVVHGAVYLITTLLATAGVFLLLQAEFLFIVQVILYVGGIMVLFIFVIMLVNLDVSLLQYQFNRQRFVAGVLALALGAQIFLAIKMGQNRYSRRPASRRFCRRIQKQSLTRFLATSCCLSKLRQFCCWSR